MTKSPNYPKGFFDIDFKSFYRKEQNGKIKERYFAMWHLQRGNQIKETADLIGVSENSICKWLRWIREEGVSRISNTKKGQGRKPNLSNSQKEELKQKIIKQQEEKKGGRLIGKDIGEIIFDSYKIEYHPNYVYEILKEIGLSWVSSRSRHPKQDKEAQEAFKKTSKI